MKVVINSKKRTLSQVNLTKRIEENGKSKLFMNYSKVKIVLSEEFEFVQERVT